MLIFAERRGAVVSWTQDTFLSVLSLRGRSILLPPWQSHQRKGVFIKRYCFICTTTTPAALTDDWLSRALKLNTRQLPVFEKRNQRGNIFKQDQLAWSRGGEGS